MGQDLSGSPQGAGGVGGLLEVSYYGSSTTNCFPAFDGNGNVAALVNAADGTIVANYEYGPFGEVIRATGPMAKANPLRFSTKYDDDESDLLYYGYRSYNPTKGTWLNRDPIEEVGGLNTYGFNQNNLIAFVDVLGMYYMPYPFPHEVEECKLCKCLAAKYGSIPTQLGVYANPEKGEGYVGPRIPYTITTQGDPTACHCKYTDNGSIKGGITFKNGEYKDLSRDFPNVETNIPCQDGSDTPGSHFTFPPTGFSLTYELDYNWNGNLTCESSDGTPPITDSASIKNSFTGSGTWRPGQQ